MPYCHQLHSRNEFLRFSRISLVWAMLCVSDLIVNILYYFTNEPPCRPLLFGEMMTCNTLGLDENQINLFIHLAWPFVYQIFNISGFQCFGDDMILVKICNLPTSLIWYLMELNFCLHSSTKIKNTAVSQLTAKCLADHPEKYHSL